MTTSPKLTHDDVAAIAGELDDARVARILETGAGPEELIEAKDWACDPAYLGGRAAKHLTGVVLELYEILTADEPLPEEAGPA